MSEELKQRPRRIKRETIILGIAALVVLLTLGYAFLTSTLDIGGTITTKANSWNIYMDNVVIKDNSISATKEPTIDPETKTDINFEVGFDLPGETYDFTFDIVNDGTIDAMIDTMSITPELTEEQSKWLEYEVRYKDGLLIKQYDLIKSNTSLTVSVHLKNRDDISSEDLALAKTAYSMSIGLTFIQADDNKFDLSIPKYVNDEIDAVVSRARTNLSSDSFLFTSFGDVHFDANKESHYYENYVVGRNNVYAMNSIRNELNTKFVGFLADTAHGGGNDTVPMTIRNIKEFSKIYQNIEGTKFFVEGNHDRNYSGINNPEDGTITNDILERYFYSNITEVTEKGGLGYGYIDYPEDKIRVIYINSSEIETDPDDSNVTYSQALYIKSKLESTPNEYKILLFSHKPLDRNGGMNGLATIIENFDYYNPGKIIATIHADSHNYAIKKISDGFIYSVTVPNAGTYSALNKDDEWAERDEEGNLVYYEKDSHTRTETAFSVFDYSRINNVMRIYNYGAGYDRTVTLNRESKIGYIPVPVVNGKTISTTSGKDRDDTEYSASDFIEIVNTLDYKARLFTDDDILVFAYNENKEIISGWGSEGTNLIGKRVNTDYKPFTLPEGTKYVRIRIHSVNPNNIIMLTYNK